jgi:hypothetical protein
MTRHVENAERAKMSIGATLVDFGHKNVCDVSRPPQA